MQGDREIVVAGPAPGRVTRWLTRVVMRIDDFVMNGNGSAVSAADRTAVEAAYTRRISQLFRLLPSALFTLATLVVIRIPLVAAFSIAGGTALTVMIQRRGRRRLLRGRARRREERWLDAIASGSTAGQAATSPREPRWAEWSACTAILAGCATYVVAEPLGIVAASGLAIGTIPASSVLLDAGARYLARQRNWGMFADVEPRRGDQPPALPR